MPIVLVITDDANQRMLMQWELGDEGYALRFAENGYEAVALAANDRLDAVVVAPKCLNGDDEFLEWLWAYRPDLPVIVWSAATSRGVPCESRKEHVAQFVMKSSRMEGLKRTLQQQLSCSRRDERLMGALKKALRQAPWLRFARAGGTKPQGACGDPSEGRTA